MVYPVWERPLDDLGPAGASERREVGGPAIEQRVPSDSLLRGPSRLRQDVDGGLQRSIRHAHYAAERVV
jgi:hypothetical protein